MSSRKTNEHERRMLLDWARLATSIKKIPRIFPWKYPHHHRQLYHVTIILLSDWSIIRNEVSRCKALWIRTIEKLLNFFEYIESVTNFYIQFYQRMLQIFRYSLRSTKRTTYVRRITR